MPTLATNIIQFLIGIALFIAGMNIMSAGLKKATGKSLKKLFNRIKNSRLAGLGIGAGVTALIQSSGATSVMVIGFINAAVMTVFQGVCIILGAYIGTTITGVLVSLSSIPNLSNILALTAFVGVVLSFIKNEKAKNIGEILIGLGILFVGLELMKAPFVEEGPLKEGFQTLFSSVTNPLLLLLFGALFTCLTQSSSATSGIVIVMAGSGAISMSAALYLVLGATIGTVIVTIIASIGGTADAKRTAIICLIIRIFTALLALAILWPVEANTNQAISKGLVTMFGGNIQFAIAMFLVFYNIIFVGLTLPFVGQFVKLGNVLIKDKEAQKKRKALKYIDDKLLINPTVALGQAKNEIVNMLELSKTNLTDAFNCLISQDLTKKNEIYEREDSIDYINSALSDYLINISHDASMKEENKIGGYFHIINDIERIGDHAINTLEGSMKMKEQDLKFSSDAIKELSDMFNVVNEMFDVSKDIFVNHNVAKLPLLHDLEDKTDVMKNGLSDSHYERLTQNKCNNQLSPYFTSVISGLERVADHLVNIGYSYLTPTGDDEHLELIKNKK